MSPSVVFVHRIYVLLPCDGHSMSHNIMLYEYLFSIHHDRLNQFHYDKENNVKINEYIGIKKYIIRRYMD